MRRETQIGRRAFDDAEKVELLAPLLDCPATLPPVGVNGVVQMLVVLIKCGHVIGIGTVRAEEDPGGADRSAVEPGYRGVGGVEHDHAASSSRRSAR